MGCTSPWNLRQIFDLAVAEEFAQRNPPFQVGCQGIGAISLMVGGEAGVKRRIQEAMEKMGF